MADDVLEFAREKELEELRKIASEIQLAIEKASNGQHQFLVYLLKMAELEANELLQADQHNAPEHS